jgi:hypothetical protein
VFKLLTATCARLLAVVSPAAFTACEKRSC